MTFCSSFLPRSSLLNEPKYDLAPHGILEKSRQLCSVCSPETVSEKRDRESWVYSRQTRSNSVTFGYFRLARRSETIAPPPERFCNHRSDWSIAYSRRAGVGYRSAEKSKRKSLLK